MNYNTNHLIPPLSPDPDSPNDNPPGFQVQPRPGQRILNVVGSNNQPNQPFFISSTKAFFGTPGARQPLQLHNMNPTIVEDFLLVWIA